MLKRSYFNPISADQRLNRADRMFWLASNILLTYLPGRRLDNVEYFDPAVERLGEAAPSPLVSPSRALSNLFWLQLPIDAIRSALGRVRLLDCGCGHGEYAEMLDGIFGGLDGYTGFDLLERKEWPALRAAHPSWRFVEASAESVDRVIDDETTFVISQSAVEHFSYDVTFFELLAERLQRPGRRSLQVHLFPPESLWRQSGPHGYRGYNEYNIPRLLEPFRGKSRCRLMVLGGPECNRVHRTHIRDYAKRFLRQHVKDVRAQQPEVYANALADAVARDAARARPVTIRESNFIALVVETGFDTPIPFASRPIGS